MLSKRRVVSSAWTAAFNHMRAAYFELATLIGTQLLIDCPQSAVILQRGASFGYNQSNMLSTPGAGES